MIWCCGHRHPYGFRRVWFNKDNNSEINTANPVFGIELINGIDTAIFHVNFIRLSEKFFDSFIKPTHFSLSVDQERFIKEYIKEGDNIINNEQVEYKKPLDFYDRILASFTDIELNKSIHNSVDLLPEKIRRILNV